MVRNLVLILTALIFFGCGSDDNSNCDGCGDYILSDTSVQILIHKTGGFSPVDETYNYTIPELSDSSYAMLTTIRVKNSDLECWADAYVYKITITDENNNTNDYYSNNAACGDVDGKNFIDTLEIEELISLF